MLLGYNTNGMAHHDLFDAIRLLAGIGYRERGDHDRPHGVAALRQLQCPAAAALRRLLDELGMRSVIETGARFLLDPAKSTSRLCISRHPAAGAAASTSRSMPSIVPPRWAAIAFRFGRACFPRASPGRRA